jgi:hypothetical protein
MRFAAHVVNPQHVLQSKQPRGSLKATKCQQNHAFIQAQGGIPSAAHAHEALLARSITGTASNIALHVVWYQCTVVWCGMPAGFEA